MNSPINNIMAKTQIIHKPNELIYIIPTSDQRITGTMRLLYNALILISQQMGKQEEYVAILNDVLQLCGLSSDFRTVKKIFKDIRRLDFEWRYIDDTIDETRVLGFIDEPRFIARKGHPTLVSWKLNSLIQDRLLDPSLFFTRINFETMTKLSRAGASLALYEIFSRYVTNNKAGGPGRTGKHLLEWWIPRIVGSHEYKPEYKFLKRDLIKPALEEINNLTEFLVELHEYKCGRTVKEIEFTITKKVALSTSEINIHTEGYNDSRAGDLSLYDRVISFGIKPGVANSILEKYQNHEYIRRHIDGLEIAYKKGTVKSPAAWLHTSLANNWKHQTNYDLPKKPRTKLKAVSSRVGEEKVKKNNSDQLAEGPIYSDEEKALAYSKFEELSDNLKSDLINEFLESTNGLVRDEYAKKKMKSSIFLIIFKQWLVESRGG
jgi:Initiator Replication protein